MNKIAAIIPITLSVLMISSCHVNPVTGKKQALVMSEEKEIALGKQYDPQISAAYGVYQDEKIQNFINTKGNEMAKVSHRPHLNYEFKIMDSPVVNAFAVPGGFVYFTRGIMAHFNNEAEFMGVLGHEIGHVTARHSVVQQRNATLAQVGLIAGMVVSPEFAAMGQQASAGVQLLLLKFGRDAESQSDELGVEYSSKVGYDAKEMAHFFSTLHRLSAQHGANEIPTFLSTHPDPLNRKENVGQLASKWQSDLNLNNPEVGRESYLQMLDGLVYGEDPRQGFVENSSFYHPELKFYFPVPSGWQYQNSPSQFQMAPQDGKAMMFLSIAQGATLQEAANAFASNYKLEVVGSNNQTLNGMQAVVAEMQQKQQAQDGTTQTTLRLRSTFIKYGDLIYNITGMTAPADFGSYSGAFDNTMRNFKVLTDTDKLNRQPDRIKLFRTSINGTLEQALKSAGIPNDRLEEFAIVNGMMLGDQVPKGTMLKAIK